METPPEIPVVQSKSPRWSSTTKLVVALIFVAILAWFFLKFQVILGPLLLSFVAAYLLYPIVGRICHWTRLPWRLVVTVIYLLGVLILLGLLTWGGLTLVDQTTSLVAFLQRMVTDLPNMLEQLALKPIQIGPFAIDLQAYDLNYLGEQLLGVVRPVLSGLGSLVGNLATGAATTVAWTAFSILVSYFILAETQGVARNMIKMDIPGYGDDLRRLGTELGRIWNSFLRGQLIMVLIAAVAYTLLLGVLGVKYFYGLAVLAGLARFVPYLGPWVTWISLGLVTYFQGSTIFGMSPVAYVVVVIVLGMLLDTILDNLIYTRVMADTLRVHPAAVMVAVIIAASVMGIIGVLLAAPVLATLKLFSDYAGYKLLDRDPWERIKPVPLKRKTMRILPWLIKAWKKIIQIFKKRPIKE